LKPQWVARRTAEPSPIPACRNCEREMMGRKGISECPKWVCPVWKVRPDPTKPWLGPAGWLLTVVWTMSLSQPVRVSSRYSKRSFAALAAAAVVAIATSAVLLLPDSPPEQTALDSASIDRSHTEARLAFALIADATRRAEDELMEGVLKERVLGTAVRGISRSFEFANRSGHEQEVSPIPNPTPKQGGMI